MQKLTNRLVSWASLIDEKTVEQARTSSTMPFIYPHLALMPDVHRGARRLLWLDSSISPRFFSARAETRCL